MLRRKKIHDIVEENYVFASVLYYFGIKFYDFSEDTLEQVCKKRGLDIKRVSEDLQNINYEGTAHKRFLLNFPVDLIIEFLKHSHHLFIKKRLPYIAHLIEELKDTDGPMHLVQDLRWIFPVFVEDFIHHAYHEEDTLFNYINKLDLASRGKMYPGKLFFEIKETALQEFAIEHEIHEEELKGIRKITNEYKLDDTFDQHLKVVYFELLRLEEELVTHASIENEILFKKGLSLERDVLKKLADTAICN